MEVLNESLEELCEDLGGGEWEVEYSVCPLSIFIIYSSLSLLSGKK
jgi:hypothetical protein